MSMDQEATSGSSLQGRLANKSFNPSDFDAAIHGERVPHSLYHPLSQLCVIRGMRHHPGFATDLRGLTPEFTRALNARCIMSNTIPDMEHDDEIPYCIWHPDVATESTYRYLVLRYPRMKYHVARACAVAGYTSLYRELDVLPEVHVAEEARDNGRDEIFDIIMSSPVKYSVMDDYTRTVDLDKPVVSALSGDTAVRSSLEIRQKYEVPVVYDHGLDFDDPDEDPVFTTGYRASYYNITEDWRIDDHETEVVTPGTSRDLSKFLYTPLPADLPAGNKDILILMAAYYGDIDRYARLRRPEIIAKEFDCLMRGIYHNTLFARCRLTDTTSTHELPYCIWYPGHPSRETLAALVRRRPEMRQQAARACIVAGFPTLFDEIDPEPDRPLIAEAKRSGDPHFSRFLEQKMVAAGKVEADIRPCPDGWKMMTRDKLTEPKEPAPFDVRRHVDENTITTSWDGIYEGRGPETGELELSVCARDTVLTDGLERLALDEVYLTELKGPATRD